VTKCLRQLQEPRTGLTPIPLLRCQRCRKPLSCPERVLPGYLKNLTVFTARWFEARLKPLMSAGPAGKLIRWVVNS
jgi:hypothetical protein